MERIIFKSLSFYETKKGLCYTANSTNLDSWYSARLNVQWVAGWAGSYLAYNDGTIQHSGEGLVPAENLADYLGSLAQYLSNHPEARVTLAHKWPHRQMGDSHWKDIAFFASLKFREGKRQFYCRNEQKVSASESKRHDRRWEEVPPWADGSLKAIMGLCNTGDHSALEWYANYKLVREYCLYHDIWAPNDFEFPTSFSIPSRSDGREWRCGLRHAFDACDSLMKAQLYEGMGRFELEQYITRLPRKDPETKEAS